MCYVSTVSESANGRDLLHRLSLVDLTILPSKLARRDGTPSCQDVTVGCRVHTQSREWPPYHR